MAGRTRKNVVVLGSTGSVGMQTLDVLRSMPDSFRVVGLSGYSRWEALARQVEEFRPEAVVVGDEEVAAKLADALGGGDVELLCGADGLRRLASWEGADVVVSAVSGAAGLPAAVAALRSGKTLALANKEAVVMCGPLLVELAGRSGGAIIPVDSEHSAVFQLLRSVEPEEVRRVILTASGGPFYGRSRDEMATVTPEEALHHPIWRMGRKITIDSATLMNKALEVIEARWLFSLSPDMIDVVIHPQSIIHCMIELVDGAVLAHMGVPDMHLPIQYALNYPARLPGAAARLDLTGVSRLEFDEPDLEAFPALSLGYRVAREGGTSGAVLNAANETAVDAFLKGRIRFVDIVTVVEMVLDRHEVATDVTFEAAMAADQWARKEANRCLALL
ncbi:MAG: 1-deoxy-D-xylulose-5-phosphate reductoisomerase [Candidatus Brocadiae bacterium]|nr:1-deoxy-D-xylulose-5-phosphate reductoisomerase [Candidatus Brocadiia bacterium]